MGPANLIHLMHLEYRNRLDCGAGQPPLIVADHRSPLIDIHTHTHQRVDHGEGIAARFDTAPRVAGDIGLVGRELGDQRLRGIGATDLDDPGRHLWVIAEGHPTLLDVGAGDVHLNGIDR